jgi:hypothetical protein
VSGVYGGVINPGGGGAAGGPFVAQGAQVVSVKDAAYGAFGTAARAVDGAITVGTNSLTTASAPNFLVGMSVIIQGAGTTGTALLATVSANGSGTTVLLSTNALTTVTSGGQVDYGWSDITAVQDAINAVSAAGGGDVWFPEGHYLFPVDSTSNSWPTITPGGYHGLRYAVEVPSNVRVKMAQGAYIRLPFNGNTSQHNCVGFAVEANASHVGVEVNIDGCAVIGNTSSFEHYGCLAIDGIDDLQFFNCRWQNLLGKGLLTQGTTAITRLIVAFCIAKNNAEQMATFVNVMWGSVTHCAVHDNIAWPAQGAEGIILSASSHFVIDDLQCYNQGTAVNMQSGTTVSDIEISRVHTDDSISVTASSATDVNIHDCLIDGTTSQGVRRHHHRSVRVRALPLQDPRQHRSEHDRRGNRRPGLRRRRKRNRLRHRRERAHRDLDRNADRMPPHCSAAFVWKRRHGMSLAFGPRWSQFPQRLGG